MAAVGVSDTIAALPAEVGWLRHISRLALKSVGSSPKSEMTRTDQTWRPPFEMADVMEEGMAEDITAGLLKPPHSSEHVQKLVVEYCEETSEHLLLTADGEPLLIARTNRDEGYAEIFIATGGDPPTMVGPAFKLTASSTVGRDGRDRYTFSLGTERCECCAYTPEVLLPVGGCKTCYRELAYIQHYDVNVGKGSIMCVEVDVPKLRADGSPECWCASSSTSPVRAGRSSENANDALRLVSVKPKWNAKVSGLTLYFYGRATKASVRNFQLAEAEAKAVAGAGKHSFLFGKTGDGTFVLDYKQPLSIVQAFAIALSSTDWS